MIFDRIIVTNNIQTDVKIESGNIISDYLIIWCGWKKLGENRTFEETHKNIINPIDNLIQTYKTHPLTLEIVEKVLSCHFAFENIEKIERMLNDTFKKQSEQMQRVSSILNIVLKVFNHKNTKRYKFYKWLHQCRT